MRTEKKFSLIFGDLEPLKVPVIVQHDLFQGDFSNPIDLCRISSMILDEELQGNGLPETWNFLKQNAPSNSRNPFKALRKLGDEEENLGRTERDSTLESSLEKITFRRQIQIWV